MRDLFTGAMVELAERGRCVRGYEDDRGGLCVLGALAVAADEESNEWAFLATRPEDDTTRLMVDAARLLLAVVSPSVDVRAEALPVPGLVSVVGGWHDAATDGQVMAAVQACAEALGWAEGVAAWVMKAEQNADDLVTEEWFERLAARDQQRLRDAVRGSLEEVHPEAKPFEVDEATKRIAGLCMSAALRERRAMAGGAQ
jgi:hypothetical protein